MARDFDAGAGTHRLYRASAPAQGTTITVAARVKPGDLSTTRSIICRDEVFDDNRVYQFRIHESKLEFIVFVGDTPYTATGATDVTTGAWHTVIGTFDGSNAHVYLDSSTSDGSVAASGNLDSDTTGVAIGVLSADTSNANLFALFDGEIAECAEFTTVLTADQRNALVQGFAANLVGTPAWYATLLGVASPETDEMTSGTWTVTGTTVTSHPGVILRRKKSTTFDYTAAGGDTTANLSGVSATGSAGSFTITGGASVTLTGVAATGSAGTITASGDIAVTLSGVAATGSAGSLTVTGGASVTLSGVSATGHAGDISVDTAGNVTVNLTGVSATGSAGTLTVTGGATVNLSGVAATGHAGDITVDNATHVSVNLSGVAATGSAGTLSVTGTGTHTLTGVSATGYAGTILATGDTWQVITSASGSWSVVSSSSDTWTIISE